MMPAPGNDVVQPLMLTYRVRFVTNRLRRAHVIEAWHPGPAAGRDIGPLMGRGIFAAVIENNSHRGRALARHHVGRVDFRHLARLVERIDASDDIMINVIVKAAGQPASARSLNSHPNPEPADAGSDSPDAIEQIERNRVMRIRACNRIAARITAAMQRYESSHA